MRRHGSLRSARLLPGLPGATSLTSGKAEAQAAVPVDGGARVADGGAQALSAVAPGAPAVNPPPVRFGACWILGRFRGVVAPPIRTPLPYVPKRIVEPPRVWGLLLHRLRRPAAVVLVPPDRVERLRVVLAPAERVNEFEKVDPIV